MRIEVRDLNKSFEQRRVLKSINLEIREEEFLGLLGPSGSGKTTLLRILAGLEFPDEGTIKMNDRDALTLSLEERQVGLVFQHYALFNHMTVFENVAFGLRVQSRGKRRTDREITERVQELLELVQLKGLDNRFPGLLSGGQRQRVALARTLAIEPKVLLLDEPFGALDAKVRIELRRWLRGIHDATGLTTVFVTHDQTEALDLADRVAIMTDGHIEQIGTPNEIYEAPHSPFVFNFLGQTNTFECEIENNTAKFGGHLIDIKNHVPDGRGVAFVRTHNVSLWPENTTEAEDKGVMLLPGIAVVRFISALGPWASVDLLYEQSVVEAEISRDRLKELQLKNGSKCRIGIRYPSIFAKHQVEAQPTTTAPKRSRWWKPRHA